MAEQTNYTEDNIRSLDWKEHIRMRPGMYIGKLGDGSSPDDGIYILIKEVLDNSIDEYVMGAGKTIEVSVKEETVSIRDYGRGIPLAKVVDVVSKMNTGGKYDSKAFKKSVGLNGVGTKAVNALSSFFKVQSFRDNKTVTAEFSQGNITLEEKPQESSQRKGTKVMFVPDRTIFTKFKFRNEYIIKMIKNSYNKYYDIESLHKTDFVNNYDIHYNMCELVYRWCKATNEEECYKIFTEALYYNISRGEFVKAILKINNISHELEKLAELQSNMSLLEKVKLIPDITLKSIANNQSLYL